MVEKILKTILFKACLGLTAAAVVVSLSSCSLIRRGPESPYARPMDQDSLRLLEEKTAVMVHNIIGDKDAAARVIPLPINERLVYKVKWMGMTVGTIIVGIAALEKLGDRPAYRVEALAETAGFFRIWPVKDRFISYMDAEYLHVVRQEIYRREGDYKKDAVVEFDHQGLKASYRHLLDGTEQVYDIPSGIQDALTAVYYFQGRDFQAGDNFQFDVYVDERNYQVWGTIQENDPMRVGGLGLWPAYFIKPLARWQKEDIKDGSAKVYLSADGRRIPLKAVVNGPLFTSVTMTLDRIISG